MKKRFLVLFVCAVVLLGSYAYAAEPTDKFFLKPGGYDIGIEVYSGFYEVSCFSASNISILAYDGDDSLSLIDWVALVPGSSYSLFFPEKTMVVVGLDVGKIETTSKLSLAQISDAVWWQSGSVNALFYGDQPNGDYVIGFDAGKSEGKAEETQTGSSGAASLDTGSRVLYDGEDITIEYSDLYVQTLGDSSFLHIEFLITNHTNREIELTCHEIFVNDCAVYISKFVHVPASCKYLHDWTNNADLYLKYGIEKVESFAMTFDLDNGSTLRSDTIYFD